jgi:Protein of unknown function (DUF3152)
MIDEVARGRPIRPPSRRRWWFLLPALVVGVSSGFMVSGPWPQSPVAHERATPLPARSSAYVPAPILEATSVPTASPSPPATPSVTHLTAGTMQLPGRVPTHGSGTFAYATRRGPVLGSKGRLHRFRVAVERGSNEDVEDFAGQVEATLGDPRGWTGGGTVRLQLVAGADPADFTVYLATRATAGDMCARGGTNIRINGTPYTSCRVSGQAVINLDRWRLSAKPYLSARVPLSVYRQYVLNHEVGHELGQHHQGCPRAGGPAPVMVQQTLTTRGCRPYAWPRRGGGFLTGPAQ